MQYEFIWLQQAHVNQPKGGVEMKSVWHKPHSCIAVAITNPITHQTALRTLLWLPLPPQWKRQDKSISQDYNLRHFLACGVINRLFFPSLSYVTWENETVRRLKVRPLSTAGLYEKCLTEWKDGWRWDWSEISQWAELSLLRGFRMPPGRVACQRMNAVWVKGVWCKRLKTQQKCIQWLPTQEQSTGITTWEWIQPKQFDCEVE